LIESLSIGDCIYYEVYFRTFQCEVEIGDFRVGLHIDNLCGLEKVLVGAFEVGSEALNRYVHASLRWPSLTQYKQRQCGFLYATSY